MSIQLRTSISLRLQWIEGGNHKEMEDTTSHVKANDTAQMITEKVYRNFWITKLFVKSMVLCGNILYPVRMTGDSLVNSLFSIYRTEATSWQ